MFYSLESIEEGGGGYAVFSGTLNSDAPPDLISEHQKALLGLLHEHIGSQLSILSVGAARTRGLGRVRLELSEFDTPELMPLERRFAQLQEKWRETNSERSGETVFTLTLNSDAIVLDELWRYCSVLDEHVLASEAPGLPACHLGERFFTGTRIVSGWNSAHRLPKEDELAITKGAAFLYKSSADPQSLFDWLQTIEAQGIGERRSEGFGQIIACHPFHWEVPKT
jgi:CRISPR-associated protein Csx10